MAAAGRAIRVLLVDDSKSVRELFRAVLETDPAIVVIGQARNGAEAVALAESLRPDLVTLDIEMPVMGGLEAIELIMARSPVPILVITALSGVRTAFAAISAGALDVMEKRDVTLESPQALVRKVQYLARVDVPAHQRALQQRERGRAGEAPRPEGTARPELVAIAASTGGTHAIQTILSRLPASFPVPILITQHIAEGFTQGMVEWLNAATALTVLVARHAARPAPGQVHVNPAEYGMTVTRQGILLDDRDPALIYRPSCDTMLRSVAATFRRHAVALIMTGMGDDGVAGMQAVSGAGGITLAQDADSSVVYGMNRLAVERGYVQQVLPLAEIPQRLLELVGDRP